MNLATNEAVIAETRKVAEGYQAYVLSLAKLKSAWDESTKAAQAIGAEKEKLSAADKLKVEFLEALTGKEGVYALGKAEVEKLLPKERRISWLGLGPSWKP